MKTCVNENIFARHFIRTYGNRCKSIGAIKRQSWNCKVNTYWTTDNDDDDDGDGRDDVSWLVSCWYRFYWFPHSFLRNVKECRYNRTLFLLPFPAEFIIVTLLIINNVWTDNVHSGKDPVEKYVNTFTRDLIYTLRLFAVFWCKMHLNVTYIQW